MAKIIKRKKKRKLSIEKLALVLMIITVPLWLFSSLFLNSLNIRLTMKYQAIEREAEKITLENQDLKKEIVKLQNKDRVVAIAEEAGMKQDLDKVTNIIAEN